MLQKTSTDFKKLFLLEFTKELIRNSYSLQYNLEELDEILDEKEKIQIKEEAEKNQETLQELNLQSLVKLIPQSVLNSPRQNVFPKKIISDKKVMQKKKPQQNMRKQIRNFPAHFSRTREMDLQGKVLTVPESHLLETKRFLKPAYNTFNKVQLDLGKLNSLIKDFSVKSIECSGENDKIVVMNPSRKLTNIYLTKEEIDEIINKFSEAAKIPISDGVYKASVGNLMLSAIVSDIVGSRFIINKIR